MREAVLATLDEATTLLAAALVRGVATPDVDLGHGLRRIGETLDRHGLAGGARRSRRLEAALVGLADAPDHAARQIATARVWAALHQLTAWLRLVRRALELDAMRPGPAAADTAPESVSPPARSVRVAPVGLVLSGDSLRLFGVARETGEDVIIEDETLDRDPNDPLDGPLVSRLMGERTTIRRMLTSEVVFLEHPVHLRGGLLTFRPSFVARPRLEHGRSGDVPLSKGAVDGAGLPVLGQFSAPRAVQVRVRWRADRPVLCTRLGAALPLAPSACRDLSLTKLLARGEVDGLVAIVRRRVSEWDLLALEHPLHGRCHPDHDPRLFALSASVLSGALSGSCAPDALWLRALLCVAGQTEDVGLAQAIASIDVPGLDDVWRLATAADLIGAERAVCNSWLEATLSSLARGVRSEGASSAWPAVDLALRLGAPSPLADALVALLQTLAVDPAPGVGDVCARAVLMARFDASEDASERTQAFFDAHLDIWTSPGDQPERWPTPLEWGWISDAITRLDHACAGPPIGPRLLASMTMPLLTLVRDAATEPGRQRSAADGLWCAWVLGLADRVVMP